MHEHVHVWVLHVWAEDCLEGVKRKACQMILFCLQSKGSFITTMHLILVKQAALSWRLLQEPDGSLLITPFFDHLGWNINKFAHKWETESIPVCKSHVFFYVCLSHYGTFSPKLMGTQCPRISAVKLKVPHTVPFHSQDHSPEHILLSWFQDKSVWWTERVI